MEELYKEKGCGKEVNRIINQNLIFDFSKINLNGYIVIISILIFVIAILSGNYMILCGEVGIIGYFVSYKILYKEINFKDGLICFENNSIIQTTFSGKRFIDCTKGIYISIDKTKHLHVSMDDTIMEDNMNDLFHTLDATYKLVIDYYDEYNERQSIVLCTTDTNKSKDEIEKFIDNFYYEEEKKVQPKETQSKIRFCM